ncbi:MAG: transferase [Proteobacteria bacterium SG_bin6]|nr:MAG: transferase [Proteobacteria bacterium SG_bin6]
MRRLRVFTWHVHGSYLHYLTHAPHDFFLPVTPDRGEGHGGRTPNFAWGANVREVPVEQLASERFDVVLYQSHRNWRVDRLNLPPALRALPAVYLEHDPPRDSPTDTRHPVDDPRVQIVHVTHFNALMWDNGANPAAVIDHGVPDLGHRYSGEIERGLVVVNGLARRGRRLGADVFARARARLPLDLVGMYAEEAGGIGEVPLAELPDFAARYRFFFHPIRYTSLGLALLEAMMLGLPIVGLATTELPTIISNGENGFIATSEAELHDAMRRLLADPGLARALGEGARATALARFGIERFAHDWDQLLRHVAAGAIERAA